MPRTFCLLLAGIASALFEFNDAAADFSCADSVLNTFQNVTLQMFSSSVKNRVEVEIIVPFDLRGNEKPLSSLRSNLLAQFFIVCASRRHNFDHAWNAENCARDLLQQATSVIHRNCNIHESQTPATKYVSWKPLQSRCVDLDGFFSIDAAPIRSPLVVADYLIDFLRGEPVTEIGTRNGDILACLSNFSPVRAVEMLPNYCEVLAARGLPVICEDLLKLGVSSIPVTPFYFLWFWESPDRPTEKVLRHLQRILRDKNAVAGKVTVVCFYDSPILCDCVS